MTQKKRFFTLQSGFVTMNPGHLTRPQEPKNLTIQQRLYASDMVTADTHRFYDEGIEKLYRVLVDHPELINDFDYRESVLMESYRVFGMDSIVPFIAHQLEVESVGYLHRKFLYEMLATASAFGKGEKSVKSLSNGNYYNILTAQDDSRHAHTGQDNTHAALKKIIDSAPLAFDMKNLLPAWTSTREGVLDLVSSLNIIFGIRNYVKFRDPSPT